MGIIVSTKSFRQDTVFKIATNVTLGVVNKHPEFGRGMTYISTIRETGLPEPSLAEMKNGGYIMFRDHPEQEEIESPEEYPIDIYCLCNDGQDKTARGYLSVWSDN